MNPATHCGRDGFDDPEDLVLKTVSRLAYECSF